LRFSALSLKVLPIGRKYLTETGERKVKDYEKETDKAVSSFLYLKEEMEKIAKAIRERAEQQKGEMA
jgi:hypothetical protein